MEFIVEGDVLICKIDGFVGKATLAGLKTCWHDNDRKRVFEIAKKLPRRML